MIQDLIMFASALLNRWLMLAERDGWLTRDDADGAVIWPQEVAQWLRARLQPAHAVALPAHDAPDADRARAATSLGLGQLAQPSSSRVTLRDLFLSDDTRAELQEILDSARLAPQIAQRFAHKVTAGLGVTCLFTGPPGTGKTLAAQAIANHLGLELYQVDLSQAVSKYIGETEKPTFGRSGGR